MTPNQPYPPYPQPAPAPQKGGAGKYILLGVGCFLLLIVGGIIALVAIGGFAAFSVGKQAVGDTKPVVESFIRTGVQNDAQAGHQIFAKQVQDEVTVSKIEALFEQRSLFEGYQSLDNQSFNIATKNGQSTCHLEGTINYSQPPSGTYKADLVQENGSWRLYNINLKRSQN